MDHVNWKTPQTGNRTQFIADVIRESLFDYAFDSNKMPSLNLHYFCKDYLFTYNLVKKGVMRSGNLIPLNEEFENMIKSAPWLPDGISLSMFSFRGKAGEYQDIIKDKSIDELKRGEYYRTNATYIDSFLSGKNGYYKQLLDQIKKILVEVPFEIQEQRQLYFCVREAICELINLGVSKTHIYCLTQNKLFRAINPDDDIEYVMDFLQSLAPKECKYHVVFGVTEKTFLELGKILPRMRVASAGEKEKLGVDHVVSIELDDYDPVSALEQAKATFLVLLNMYNSFVHSDDISVVDSGLVKGEGERKYRKINSPPSIMKRNKLKPKNERIKLLVNALPAIRRYPITSSFELHNIAVTSENPETQLLMLWTIFELMIDAAQDNMSKVNYITNAVSAVLCNTYYRHVLEALYMQIALTKSVKSTIKKEMRGTTNIEKLAFILKDNTLLQNELIADLTNYPLEVYKIRHYSDIFSEPEKIKKDWSRHSKRLRWQLMRIYRNRCMIVHDGSHLPYINSITENLHFYVDDLLEYMINYFGKGFVDPDAILSEARIKEKRALDILGDKSKQITDDDFIKIICSQ